MKAEPLNDKKMIAYDLVGVHPIGFNYDKKGTYFYNKYIESAVKWLHEKVSEKTTDGITDLWVNKLINEAFKDVTKK